MRPQAGADQVYCLGLPEAGRSRGRRGQGWLPQPWHPGWSSPSLTTLCTTETRDPAPPPPGNRRTRSRTSQGDLRPLLAQLSSGCCRSRPDSPRVAAPPHTPQPRTCQAPLGAAPAHLTGLEGTVAFLPLFFIPFPHDGFEESKPQDVAGSEWASLPAQAVRRATLRHHLRSRPHLPAPEVACPSSGCSGICPLSA